MKTLLLLTIFAHFHISYALMSLRDFVTSGLLRCYDTNMQDNRRVSLRNINGQVLPLPNSIETFISLVERYESQKPNEQTRDMVGKLLKSFRIDDLYLEVDDELRLRDTSASFHSKIKRTIFSVPDNLRYEFDEDDFTEDEQCALHFMLSHTVNDSKVDVRDEVLEDDPNIVKQPRELGVVSLHSKKKHAFALGRVLLGIYAAYLPSSTEEITTIIQKVSSNKIDDESLKNTKISLVYAVTIGDLITRVAIKEDKILPNGEWSDTSCPTVYRLDENNRGFVTYSELRGAIDGLIIGRKIQENRDLASFRLSQILRQYYGFTGMIDTERTRWCARDRNFQNVPDFENEMFNYNKLYKAGSETGIFGNSGKTQDKIRNVIAEVRNNVFKDVEREECSISELSLDRKFLTPRNIFAILDYTSSGSTKINFQAEVIGNLSSDFDLRPRGNLMGVYSNQRPLQQNTLDVIVKNSGISGCPACFATYYTKTGNKEDEAELLKDLNDTLTSFDLEQEQQEEKYQSDMKAASPGKVVLLFNFGSPNIDNRVHQALWDLKRYFGGVTILAIGENREALIHFVDNDQTDIFPTSAKTIQDLKQRISKVPGEFTYKACAQSSPARESDNKQEAYISPNKIQYWAMYPQYFLKSYGVTLKFRPQDGTSIRVCFTRSYSSLMEGKNENCQESTGGEIDFYISNPCYKRNVYNCDPFYFSVEGKKQPTSYCQSLRCSTQNDIRFEFEHQGISCNVASYISVSTVAILFAAIMYHFQKL